MNRDDFDAGIQLRERVRDGDLAFSAAFYQGKAGVGKSPDQSRLESLSESGCSYDDGRIHEAQREETAQCPNEEGLPSHVYQRFGAIASHAPTQSGGRNYQSALRFEARTHGSTPLILPKIMRPAAVWRTLVTMTDTLLPM